MEDLRLQMDYRTRWQSVNALQPAYRFGRDNGWHCGHWHWSVDDAVMCVADREAQTPKRPLHVSDQSTPASQIADYIREALSA